MVIAFHEPEQSSDGFMQHNVRHHPIAVWPLISRLMLCCLLISACGSGADDDPITLLGGKAENGDGNASSEEIRLSSELVVPALDGRVALYVSSINVDGSVNITVFRNHVSGMELFGSRQDRLVTPDAVEAAIYDAFAANARSIDPILLVAILKPQAKASFVLEGKQYSVTIPPARQERCPQDPTRFEECGYQERLLEELNKRDISPLPDPGSLSMGSEQYLEKLRGSAEVDKLADAATSVGLMSLGKFLSLLQLYQIKKIGSRWVPGITVQLSTSDNREAIYNRQGREVLLYARLVVGDVASFFYRTVRYTVVTDTSSTNVYFFPCVSRYCIVDNGRYSGKFPLSLQPGPDSETIRDARERRSGEKKILRAHNLDDLRYRYERTAPTGDVDSQSGFFIDLSLFFDASAAR